MRSWRCCEPRARSVRPQKAQELCGADSAYGTRGATAVGTCGLGSRRNRRSRLGLCQMAPKTSSNREILPLQKPRAPYMGSAMVVLEAISKPENFNSLSPSGNAGRLRMAELVSDQLWKHIEPL